MSTTCVSVNLDLTAWVWVGVAADLAFYYLAYRWGRRRGRREGAARALAD